MSDTSLNREQAILDAASELIITISPELRLLFANPQARTSLAIPEGLDLTQQELWVADFHKPEVFKRLKEKIFPHLIEGQSPWQGELEFVALNGQSLPVQLTILLHTDEAGRPLWLTGIGRDLSQHKRLEAQARLAQQVFDNAIEGIIVTDGQARIEHVNPAFTEITGYTAKEVIGLTPKMLRSQHHDQSFYDAMWQSIAEQDTWKGEIWNRRKDGSVYLQWLSISCVRNFQGQIEHYISIFHDLTEMRAKEARIQHLVHHDPLTGLGNRHLLNERLSHALRQAEGQNEQLVLILLDLGNIQLINDSLGHSFCDRLIRVQSEKLRARVAAADTLVRIGADEFAVLVEDYQSVHDISQLAQELKESLQQEIDLQEHRVTLSPSLGAAFFPRDAKTADELLIHAQAALLEAKKAGRDTFRFFDQAMSKEAREKLHLEQALRSAIKSGCLSLHYQPKVRLQTNQVYGAEALLRWQHPELGPVSPAVFIPLAEDSGLIVEIGAWVIRQACADLAAWHDRGLRSTKVAVNLSVQQLEQDNLVDYLDEQLTFFGLNRECLELEITETGLMKNEERALKSLHHLRSRGFNIALDDFGTGYSSLSYLRKLPLSTLKIDRSFIQDMSEDAVSRSIVQTIVQLAQNLGLNLVAEGIELPQQASQLLEMGCQNAQGFLFFKPMTAADFIQLLASSSN